MAADNTETRDNAPDDHRRGPRALTVRHAGSGFARRTEARLRAGLTQQEVAERMGTDRANVTAWETTREPGPVNLVRLARAIGCRVDDLLPELEDLG